jgi:hypothetical protein
MTMGTTASSLMRWCIFRTELILSGKATNKVSELCREFVPMCRFNKRNLAVKFNSGVTFTWSIESDGFSKPLGTAVGLASNQFENFQVFKGNGTKLVTDNDGVDLFIIYTVN